MRRISAPVEQPLKWMQPSALKMQYELRTGEDVVAALRFRSMWGTFATAECADGWMDGRRYAGIPRWTPAQGDYEFMDDAL